MISIDTLRADHLGCYGYPRDTSPHIDGLAAEGVLFETMVAESSWTLPSHMTLFTGLSSTVHGIVDDGSRLDDARVTLAEVLRAHGYRTEGYVSAPYVHPIFGFDQGFDRYEVIGETFYDAAGFSLEKLRTDPELQAAFAEADVATHRTRSSDELAERFAGAIDRLEDSPFFLFVHMFDVHHDYDPPPSYWRRFNPEYRGDFNPVGYVTNPAVHDGMPEEDLDQIRALYDGEILWTDEHLGKMLEVLGDRGLDATTLVVVIGDHGEEFFEHGSKGHRHTLFDEQLLVPFVLRLPDRLPAGRRLAMQVRMIDVMPTIFDILGIRAGGDAMGRSLLPYIRGKEPERDLPALSTLVTREHIVRTLRGSGLKLRVTRPSGSDVSNRVELFDLEEDPGEQSPRSGGDELTGKYREFRALVEREQELHERLATGRDNSLTLPKPIRSALEALGYVE